MKTFSPKQENIKASWFILDVSGKTLGKVATKLAMVLRGKNKPSYSPHVDCGDFVIVINAKEIKLTGAKVTQKLYHHHTRYGSGLRETTPQRLLESNPEKIITHAVAGMIPQNKLKKHILKKLKVYGGSEHKHTAQEPKELVL